MQRSTLGSFCPWQCTGPRGSLRRYRRRVRTAAPARPPARRGHVTPRGGAARLIHPRPGEWKSTSRARGAGARRGAEKYRQQSREEQRWSHRGCAPAEARALRTSRPLSSGCWYCTLSIIPSVRSGVQGGCFAFPPASLVVHRHAGHWLGVRAHQAHSSRFLGFATAVRLIRPFVPGVPTRGNASAAHSGLKGGRRG